MDENQPTLSTLVYKLQDELTRVSAYAMEARAFLQKDDEQSAMASLNKARSIIFMED